MPCNSDYMAPNSREVESKDTAELLVYFYKDKLNKKPPTTAFNAARQMYGDINALDDMVVELCNQCGKHYDSLVLDINSEMDRRLSAWWNRHKAADEARIHAEQDAITKAGLVSQALNKLTPAEKQALGLQ